MLATYRQQLPPLFGKLPQELYREIYDYDDTYQKIFGDPKFLSEMQNMILQIKYPIQYKMIRKLIKDDNDLWYEGCINANKRYGRPVYSLRLVPVEYHIEILDHPFFSNCINFKLTPINSMDTDYNHSTLYGCICEPSAFVSSYLSVRDYFRWEPNTMPEISDRFVIFSDTIKDSYFI